MGVSSDPRQRWFSVGTSSEADADTAGRQAARGALAGDDPQLLVVFASSFYDPAVLVHAVNDASGGAPLIGCTTAGEISGDGATTGCVVVAALGGPGFAATTAAVAGAGADLRQCGYAAAATAAAGSTPRAHRTMVILTDRIAGDQGALIRGVYGAVGPTLPLVGGLAGDDLRFETTHQFCDDRVHRDAVVAAMLDSDGPIGIGVRHGWRRIGDPMLVTSADDDRVYTLDDEPAVDVYRRLLGVPETARRDAHAFEVLAALHPLGVSCRNGVEVRLVGDADLSDGSLRTFARVPEGGMAWLMEGDVDSMQQATVDACGDALAGLDGQAPIGGLVFDCVGRRRVLGDDGMRTEVATIAAGTRAPLAGLYTYGEIARLGGPNGFHNQTLVVVALG
jgi:hypothetical protein